MGSVSVTKVHEGVFGDRRRALLQITMSSSYATGGDSFTLDDNIGFGTVEAVIPHQLHNYSFSVDTSNNKVLCYDASGTEITAGTDLSSVSFYCEIYGW